MSVVLPDERPASFRRWKLLRISNPSIVDLCKINGTVLSEGMPEDAKAIKVTVDSDYSIAVVIESESFDQIPEAQLIPEMTVRFTRIYA